jgi:hypothetical protein
MYIFIAPIMSITSIKRPTGIYLIIFLFFTFSRSQAQTRFQQLTLGGGAGIATAYAGADVAQANPAFYANICYYPFQVFNIELEGQSGTLSGVAKPHSRDLKSFSNKYQAVTVGANLYLGAFFDPQKDPFLNVIKNFYGGIGYGVITNSVNNIDLANLSAIDHVNNTLKMIPIKGGFEWTFVRNKYNEPVLKADFSTTFNYTIGHGLDGYYDNYGKSFNFYNYYTVGLKYTIIIKAAYGKDYNKFD